MPPWSGQTPIRALEMLAWPISRTRFGQVLAGGNVHRRLGEELQFGVRDSGDHLAWYVLLPLGPSGSSVRAFSVRSRIGGVLGLPRGSCSRSPPPLRRLSGFAFRGGSLARCTARMLSSRYTRCHSAAVRALSTRSSDSSTPRTAASSIARQVRSIRSRKVAVRRSGRLALVRANRALSARATEPLEEGGYDSGCRIGWAGVIDKDGCRRSSIPVGPSRSEEGQSEHGRKF